MVSLVYRIVPVVRTVDPAVTEIFLTDVVITPANIEWSDQQEGAARMFLLPALLIKINVGLSPVGSDHERQPGGPGPGVERAQVEPDQEFSSRLVKCQPGLVAAQSAAAVEGDEGDQVVLTELDIVGALLLLRVLAENKMMSV